MNPEDLGPAGRAALAACRDNLDGDDLARRAAIVEAYVLACDNLERLHERHRRERYPLLELRDVALWGLLAYAGLRPGRGAGGTWARTS